MAVHILAAFGVAVSMVVFFLLGVILEHRRAKRRSVETFAQKARRIGGKNLWRFLETKTMPTDGSLIVRFVHLWLWWVYLTVLVSEEHPDFGRFRKLKDGAILTFDAVERLAPGANENNLSEHLRIRDIT